MCYFLAETIVDFNRKRFTLAVRPTKRRSCAYSHGSVEIVEPNYWSCLLWFTRRCWVSDSRVKIFFHLQSHTTTRARLSCFFAAIEIWRFRRRNREIPTESSRKLAILGLKELFLKALVLSHLSWLSQSMQVDTSWELSHCAVSWWLYCQLVRSISVSFFPWEHH